MPGMLGRPIEIYSIKPIIQFLFRRQRGDSARIPRWKGRWRGLLYTHHTSTSNDWNCSFYLDVLVLVIWCVRVVAVADVFGLFNHWTIFLLLWTVAAAAALPNFFASLGPDVYACETLHAPSPAVGSTS